MRLGTEHGTGGGVLRAAGAPTGSTSAPRVLRTCYAVSGTDLGLLLIPGVRCAAPLREALRHVSSG
eukprot:1038038-Rhodomonas_salina.2